jgi:hypothetical protein
MSVCQRLALPYSESIGVMIGLSGSARLAPAGSPIGVPSGPANARLAAANAVALQFGWHLFRPFLTSGLDLGEVGDAALKQSVAAAVGRIVEPG